MWLILQAPERAREGFMEADSGSRIRTTYNCPQPVCNWVREWLAMNDESLESQKKNLPWYVICPIHICSRQKKYSILYFSWGYCSQSLSTMTSSRQKKPKSGYCVLKYVGMEFHRDIVERVWNHDCIQIPRQIGENARWLAQWPIPLQLSEPIDKDMTRKLPPNVRPFSPFPLLQKCSNVSHSCVFCGFSVVVLVK